MTDNAKLTSPHAELLASLMDPCLPKTEREHAAVREIERLRANYTAIIQWLRGQGLLVRHKMCTRPDNILGPAWVLRRVYSVAGDSCLGWHEDDPVAAVEAALKVMK